MTDIAVLDKNFQESGKLKSTVDLGAESVKVAVVHQIVKATLAGRRQGTACTKTRGLVSGGGRKPYKQKGTGRARQGSIRSPLLIGGGTAFGPQPRDYTQKVNKKMAKVGIQSIIADKLQSGKLTVVEAIESDGKTKGLYKTLSSRELLPALIVTASKDSLALRAAQNLEKGKGLPVEGFSVYEAVKYENLVIEREALETLLKKLV